jgi:hypothetical protein
MKLRDILMTAGLSIPLAFGAIGCGENTSKGKNATPPTAPATMDKASETVLSYAAQPTFANADLLKQTTGTNAELQTLDLDEGKVYFSMPRTENMRKDLETLSKDVNALEYGQYSDGKSKLGGYTFRSKDLFFRMPTDNFRVKPDAEITIPYDSANYVIKMNELVDFSENKSIYGGKLIFLKPNRIGFANHGAFVAKKGESSLKRLVDALVPKKSTKEQAAQKLLDFVTKEIKYNHAEANGSAETLKRPNEVLMTGKSDCSGITTLYASLLEQAGVDYRLFYLDDHICVGINGDFDNLNGRCFQLGKAKYFIAEPTVEGYQIGSTRVTRDMQVKDIVGIQKPGENAYNPKTGKDY